MNQINNVEEKVNIHAFIYKGENIWPLFRGIIGWNSEVETHAEAKVEKTISKITIILSCLIHIFDVIKLFKRYDYIVFSMLDNYRVVDNKKVNIFTHKVTTLLNGSRFLEIQHGGKKLEKESVNKNITHISYDVIAVIGFILSKFIFLRERADIDRISTELSKVDSTVNCKKIVKRYLADQIIYRFIFKLAKPKILFSTCYAFMNAIKCANTLNIDTFEFQHGAIEGHFAYDIQNDINGMFYPKFIGVFGEKTSSYLEKRYYIKNKKNIMPLGSFLIDHYKLMKNEKILNLKNKFKLLICVTLQWTVINSVVDYIIDQARINDDICFILIPRKKSDLDEFSIDYSNVKVFSDINTYEIITNCDFHLTCYSTCGIEAPSLGVKNMFLNYNNLSSIYYGDYIKNKEFNAQIKITDNIKMLDEYLKPYNKNKVAEQNNDYIYNSYDANINKMLYLFG